MSDKSSKKGRVPYQSATGNAVFTLTAIVIFLYIGSGILIFAFPAMVEISVGLKFNNLFMGIMNFGCAGGQTVSAIYIKKRKYYMGSTLLLLITIIGSVIGGGFLIAPLFGVIGALIGFICDPLEQKLYERYEIKQD